MVKIYCLTHPTSSKLYVGKTTRTLGERLSGHMDECRRLPWLIKSKWMRSLLDGGMSPNIDLIAKVDDVFGNQAEINYIRLAMQVAPDDILNSPHRLGGNGFSKGGILDKKAIKKRAVSKRKFTNNELKQIANRINHGELIKDIAKELGVHRVTISRNLNAEVVDTEKIEYHKNRASREKHPSAKINQQQADEIRKRYATGNCFQHQLAKEFDISQANVWSILKYQTWK